MESSVRPRPNASLSGRRVMAFRVLRCTRAMAEEPGPTRTCLPGWALYRVLLAWAAGSAWRGVVAITTMSSSSRRTLGGRGRSIPVREPTARAIRGRSLSCPAPPAQRSSRLAEGTLILGLSSTGAGSVGRLAASCPVIGKCKTGDARGMHRTETGKVRFRTRSGHGVSRDGTLIDEPPDLGPKSWFSQVRVWVCPVEDGHGSAFVAKDVAGATRPRGESGLALMQFEEPSI